MEIASHLAANASGDIAGASVRAEVFDQVRAKVDTLAEIFWKDLTIAAIRAPGATIAAAGLNDGRSLDSTGIAIERIVHQATNSHLSRIRYRARHMFLKLRGRASLWPARGFQSVAISPHDMASLAAHEYLHDVAGGETETQALRGLWRIGMNAGWVVPYERTCWVSKRPTRIATSADGLLHCADGPALLFEDGWSVHAWKGVPVPSWLIEHPERITLSTIEGDIDPVLRNCMIDIMTPERFVEIGGARLVCKDEFGTLWRKIWWYRDVPIGSWSAVEVVNGTTGTDGCRKRYFLRVPTHFESACDAVAWTYGMSGDQYARLDLRT
jgi:hypothetical protein